MQQIMRTMMQRLWLYIDKKDKLPKVKETNAMCIRALARAFDLRDTKTNKKVA